MGSPTRSQNGLLIKSQILKNFNWVPASLKKYVRKQLINIFLSNFSIIWKKRTTTLRDGINVVEYYQAFW